MVVYEVNLEFDVAIAAAYRAWLEAHVAEIAGAARLHWRAQVHEVRRSAPTAGAPGPVRALPVCATCGALETYLREHAPRLRADGLPRFGERRRAHAPPRAAGVTTLICARHCSSRALQPRRAVAIGRRQQRLAPAPRGPAGARAARAPPGPRVRRRSCGAARAASVRAALRAAARAGAAVADSRRRSPGRAASRVARSASCSVELRAQARPVRCGGSARSASRRRTIASTATASRRCHAA